MQKVDPLADSNPPRHAYESDDSDEDGFALGSTQNRDQKALSSEVWVRIDGDAISKTASEGGVRSLIFVTGSAGRAWARGPGIAKDLGEQVGRVVVGYGPKTPDQSDQSDSNGSQAQVGLVFQPKWTLAGQTQLEGQSPGPIVIVSEVSTKLPIGAMYPYAQKVLEVFNSQRLAILDSYPTSSYISSEPILVDEAPIRFLHTSRPPVNPPIPEKIYPHTPPNLLQFVSAALLSLASLPSPENKTESATTILLPSRNTPAPPPRGPGIAASDFNWLASDRSSEWDVEQLLLAHQVLLDQAGISPDPKWTAKSWQSEGSKGGTRSGKVSSKRRGDVGDGGMYI